MTEMRTPSLVLEMFETRSAMSPENVAALDGASALTYEDLDSQATELAGRLVASGAGNERVVGLMAGRGFEMLVGLLGILKSGSAFLPLDASLPVARRHGMLRETAAVAVLTRDGKENPKCQGIPVIGVQADTRPIPDRSDGVAPAVGTRNLAYVIYTSGSSGHPKGVMVEHGALANFVRWSMAWFRLGPGDRVLQFAPLTFDASIWEIFPALCTGATVVLVDEQTRRSSKALGEVMQHQAVTHCDLLPGVLRLMDETAAPGLRYCMTGGDPVTQDVVDRWTSENRVVVNGYGPTEATDLCVVTECRANVEGPPPIGRPIAGMRAYVLDHKLREVDYGGVGELVIAGPGLARGYLANPRATAAAFRPDPFSGVGARMYRTGDLVRWTPSGDLEFLGRADDQVKISGHRVEPGEIETLLHALPEVEDAAVVAPRDASGRARLVAYVVCNCFDESALRRTLEERLPPALIPRYMVPLDSIPRTSSGKVDRIGLRDRGIPLATTGRDLGRGPLENAIEEVLGVPPDRSKSAMDLGVDSLDAMRIVVRLNAAHMAGVSVESLLSSASVDDLARSLLPLNAAAAGDDGERSNNDRRLNDAEARLAFLQELHPASTAYALGFAIRLRGPLRPEALIEAFRLVCARHLALHSILRHDSAGNPCREPSTLPELQVDLSAADERDALSRAQALVRSPFELAVTPPLRAVLLPLTDTSSILALATHHSAFDGWSLRVFLRDLGAYYDQLAHQGPGPRPPDVPWRRHRAPADEDLAYWKRVVAATPATLTLPTDYPRPAVQAGDGATVELPLAPEAVDRLRQRGRDQGVTLFSSMMAALAFALGEWTGQRGFFIAVPASTRDTPAMEDVIGCYVETVPIAIDLTGGADPWRVIRAHHEEALAAVRHRAFGFGQIVSLAACDRDLSRQPLAQVNFQVESSRLDVTRWQSVHLETTDLDRGGSIADIAFRVVERPGSCTMMVEYDKHLFRRPTIEALSQSFIEQIDDLTR